MNKIKYGFFAGIFLFLVSGLQLLLNVVVDLFLFPAVTDPSALAYTWVGSKRTIIDLIRGIYSLDPFFYILLLFFSVVFFFGFRILGFRTRNELLRFSSIALIPLSTFYFILSAVISFLPPHEVLIFEVLLPALLVAGLLFGFCGLFFGVGVAKTRDHFGGLSMCAGFLDVVFRLLFLSWVWVDFVLMGGLEGSILNIPLHLLFFVVVIFESAILYKASKHSTVAPRRKQTP